MEELENFRELITGYQLKMCLVSCVLCLVSCVLCLVSCVLCLPTHYLLQPLHVLWVGFITQLARYNQILIGLLVQSKVGIG